MLARIHVRNGAASDNVRHAVVQQRLADDEHTRCAGPADKLMWADEHRVFVRERMIDALWVHLYVHIRCRSGEVPERQRSVTVQQIGDVARVRHDARYVRRRRERADLQQPILVSNEFCLQISEIDMAISVLGDDHDIGNGLAPRKLVGVVLERADEHDRTFVLWNLSRQVVAIVEIGGDSQVHDADELVDRPGRTGPTEDHARLVVASDRFVNDRSGIFTKSGGL